MQVTKDIDTFDELYRNSWSGAVDTLNDIQNADKEEELMQHLEEVFFDSTPSETDVNDYLWHDRSSVYSALGLNENGEIPSIAEELLEQNNCYGVTLEEIDEMNKTGLFPTDILVYLTNEIKESGKDTYFFDMEEFDANMESELTDDMAEWIDGNL